MKGVLRFVWLMVACLTGLGMALGQNAVVGPGFSSGWGGGSCPTGNTNFTFLSAGAGTTFGATLTPNGTGDQFFRFGVDWGGTTAQRTITIGSDVTVTTSTTYTLNTNCTTSGAMRISVGNASYRYVFKTLNAGTNPTGTFVVFEVQGTVQTISSVTQAPASNAVVPGSAVTVTANLSGALSNGQNVYLRYTTNNFTTSTVVAMTGSGTTYTATIPAGTNTAGANVSYYVFTSGPSNVAADGSNADLYTINLNNNGGANYSYTINVSSASDIVDNTSYSSTAPDFNINPSYINFTDATATTAGKIIAMKFQIRDGGATNDIDNLPTILTSLTFNVTNTANANRGNYIKQAILTNQSGTVLAAASNITTSQIVFTGLTDATFTIADNSSSSNLHLRVSFNEANVSDNEKLVYTVAAAAAGTSGSQFASSNAGGARTDNSTGDDRNRIEAIATMFAFVQQPSNTGFGQTMTPAPSVEARDVNGRRDLDFTGAISLTSSGTMTGSPISVSAVAGLATYASVVHTVQQTSRTLTASGSLTSAVSSAFDVNASSGTTDFFRTANGFTAGNWNNAGSWESSPDNITWVSSTVIPNSSAARITLRSGTLTIDAAASAKLLTVQSGAVLVHPNSVSFTIADDGSATDDFIVQGRYELNGTQPSFNTGASMVIAATGEVKAVTNSSPSESDNFARNTAVKWQHQSLFNWATNLIFEASGETYFPNTAAGVIPVFRLSNNTGNIGGAGTTTINGVFECLGNVTFQSATAIVFRNGITGTGTITQSSSCGQFRITGTTSQLGSSSGTLTLSLRNDVNSGLALQAGACTLQGNITSNSGPIYIDGGATLIAGTFSIVGTSSFTLNNNANLVTAHPNGVNGSIALGGSKNFNDGANYTFNGNTDQTTGSLMGTTIGSLTINNPNTVTLSQSGHTTTTLNLQTGSFRCGTNQNLNIATGGSINSTGGNQPNDPSAGTITFLGGGQTNGTNSGEPKLYCVNINGSVDFNGSSNTQSATIWNTLQLNAGSFVVDAPFYHNSSTLVYNTGGSYNRSVEWGQPTPGAQGYPYNVLVQNSTTVNLATNTPASLEIGGNLTIGTSSSSNNTVDMNAATMPLRILGNLTIGDPATSLNRLTMSTSIGGDLELYGNFTRYKNNNYYDNEAYNGGRGRSTIFKGSSASVVDVIDAINPANEVQKFHKLVTDKTGSGDVTILVPNLYIESELDLKNGIIHTSQGTPPGASAAPPGLGNGLLTLESAAFVTGSTSATCFVNGQIAKQFGTSTATEFIFPVGKSGTPIPNRPFWFSKNNTATGTMKGEYFYYAPPHIASGVSDNYASSLMGIVNTEYWQFDKTTGDISGKVIIDYKNPGSGKWRGPNGTTGVDPCANCNVAVVKRNNTSGNGVWDFTSVSGVFASSPASLPEYRWYQNDGRISSSVVSSFSPFTIGFSYNVVLGNSQSARLLEFSGTVLNGDGLLNWTMDRTGETIEFMLQHSLDGIQFETISRKPVAGLKYNHVHPQLTPGRHFYRLLVRDRNGSSYYSSVVELVIDKAPTSITGLQSTVVSHYLTALLWSSINQQAKATIYDRAGKLISQQQSQLLPGNNNLRIPVALLATGLYYVELVTGDGVRKTLRWLKE